MAMGQYFEEAVAQNHLTREDKSSPDDWKSSSDAVANANDSPSGGFDCNICLASVQDPVVTFCGHLYCWPCIYKWLHFQSISTEDQNQKQLQCPVCKAEVSTSTIVPLYGRCQTTKTSNGKVSHLGLVIPKRPLGPSCRIDSPGSAGTTMNPHFTPPLHHHNHSHHSHLYYSQPGSYALSPMLGSGGITANLFDSVIGMFGEMVYARVFGNSITNIYTYPNSFRLTGSTSPRMRRRVMPADKSLNRICFFLFCCLVLCLLLF